MHKIQDDIYYSPSDLTLFMDSAFASWMDRLALEHPDRAPQRDTKDALLDALSQKGQAHETAIEAQFKAQGKSVVKISEGSDQQYRLTLEAMHQGIEVIAQAHLQQRNWRGFADFLVKVTHDQDDPDSAFGPWHYEVWDAKLSNTVKPSFLIQLCCYANMLESMQHKKPGWVTLVLGDGSQQRFKTQDYYYYFQALQTAFIAIQTSFNLNEQPDPGQYARWGNWSDYAQSQLIAHDHLIQVATITQGQIKKLSQANITTMQQLAELQATTLSGLPGPTLAKLKAQARIQCQSVGLDVPQFEIIIPPPYQKTGLALLPPSSPLDVFFDIEGYPLIDGGLEYLWGCTYFNGHSREFIDFWAHNAAEERQCFQEFIEWVYARWQQDPSMHIYHYANYEIAACRKLMGRYGICEHEVDQLLRNEVFVDLYKVVKSGVLLGEPRYSIKNVEHLYRAQRATEVGNGADSVVVYEQWRVLHQAGQQGATWQTSKILKDIRDYNIDDCNSTQELEAWLRQQKTKYGISFLGKIDIVEPEVPDEITERTILRDQLLERSRIEAQTDPVTAAVTENLAWMLEFHRREAKPVFWRQFDRLAASHDELIDDLDCLANGVRTQRPGYKVKPKARNLGYEYQFQTTQDFKGNQKQYFLLGLETEDGKQVKVTFVREDSDLEAGLVVVTSKTEPPSDISLVPDEYVNPKPIPAAIERCVRDYAEGTLRQGQSAILDFLMRAPPRLTTKATVPLIKSLEPQERLKDIVQCIRSLDHSYLTIQGPPGAGKSYTGKHVIAALMQTGARIGITSNSHKAINNLLLSTAEHCLKMNIRGAFTCTKDTEANIAERGVSIVKNSTLAQCIDSASVVGTTAWGFAREDMADQLDYLFIDEAGQVSVANLIAMSRSSKNLILMGDQMQLGQPCQGTHPADSGLSVLDYLLRDTPTIPDTMGIFLGTTYRMHSRVNQCISDHIYEGKLKSHQSNDQRIIEVPDRYEGALNTEAGLLFIPVSHEGNTQASDEEVDEIDTLAQTMLGRIFHTGLITPSTRPITWDDMLFVAPYNHQVSKLQAKLGDQAKVGSVDKFQGQEAPIIFLSMCSSDAGQSPRGLEFLFDTHRINVAVSRAQTIAIIVANPNIGNTVVQRVDQMKLINTFNGIVNTL